MSDDIFELADSHLFELPKNVKVYITDQSHESQIGKLPEDAIPGFVTSIYKGKKRLQSMWSQSLKQAEYIADEYIREYLCNMIWEGRR